MSLPCARNEAVETIGRIEQSSQMGLVPSSFLQKDAFGKWVYKSGVVTDTGETFVEKQTGSIQGWSGGVKSWQDFRHARLQNKSNLITLAGKTSPQTDRSFKAVNAMNYDEGRDQPPVTRAHHRRTRSHPRYGNRDSKRSSSFCKSPHDTSLKKKKFRDWNSHSVRKDHPCDSHVSDSCSQKYDSGISKFPSDRHDSSQKEKHRSAHEFIDPYRTRLDMKHVEKSRDLISDIRSFHRSSSSRSKSSEKSHRKHSRHSREESRHRRSRSSKVSPRKHESKSRRDRHESRRDKDFRRDDSSKRHDRHTKFPLDGATFFGANSSSASSDSGRSSLQKENRLEPCVSTPTEDPSKRGSINHRRESSQSKHFERADHQSDLAASQRHSANLKNSIFNKEEVRRRITPQITPRSVDRKIDLVDHIRTPSPRQENPRRGTPSKGELKPKALLKTGLRSAKKESSRLSRERRPTPSKRRMSEDSSNKKLIQSTLEAFPGFYKRRSDEHESLDVVRKCQSDLGPGLYSTGKSQRLSEKETKSERETTRSNDKSGSENPGNSNAVRRIYQEDSKCKLKVKPVVRLTSLPLDPENGTCNLRSSPRGRKSEKVRLAQVAPIPSPAKKRLCDSPPLKEPKKTARGSFILDDSSEKAVSSLTKSKSPVKSIPLQPCKASPVKLESALKSTRTSPEKTEVTLKTAEASPAKREPSRNAIKRESPRKTAEPPSNHESSLNIVETYPEPRGSPRKGAEPAPLARESPRKSAEAAAPAVETDPPDVFRRPTQFHSEGTLEEYAQSQRDEAASAAEAERRKKKRHTRGLKVMVFCDVLAENIERHPVQNEVPPDKWSKWLNPTQLRVLVTSMLDNTELCLKYSLEAERNEEWEVEWTKLASRLNTVCFSSLTNLNTGLRMTVLEWKTLWLQVKGRLLKRVQEMKPEERVHSLGALECLLFSEDLYKQLMKSNGACIGAQCPRLWCTAACEGVVSPCFKIDRRTGTEE